MRVRHLNNRFYNRILHQRKLNHEFRTEKGPNQPADVDLKSEDRRKQNLHRLHNISEHTYYEVTKLNRIKIHKLYFKINGFAITTLISQDRLRSIHLIYKIK